MGRKVEACPLGWLPTDGVAVDGDSRPDHGGYCPRRIALQRKLKPMSNLKRKKRRRKEEETSSLSALPYDVALLCVARVRRCDHPSLNLLSKSFRSLVASPDLHKIRSTMGITDTEVYVCLRTPPDPNPAWYILRRSSSSLIPVSSSSSQHLESSVVTLGSAIYVIGGRMINGVPTSDVSRLDCRTHTWHSVPSMGVARASPVAAVVDGKIYVLGGCDLHDDSLSWGEVFDPKTQAWESLPSPSTRHRIVHDCLVKDGRIYAVNGVEKTLYYSPSEGVWGEGNRGVVIGGPRRDWCMLGGGNVLYSINKHGRIFWCEQDELDWREEPEGGIMDWWNEVKGLEALTANLSRSRLVHFGVEVVSGCYRFKHHFPENKDLASLLPGARLCSSAGGGNMLLFWDQMVGNIQKIWCAEVSLERRRGGQGGGEIWGNVEWSRAVMTVADDDPFARPGRCKLLHSVSVTL